MGSGFLNDWHFTKPEVKEMWRKTFHDFNNGKSVAILTILARTFYQDSKYQEATAYSNKSVELLLTQRVFSSPRLGDKERSAYWLLADATYNNHFRILHKQGIFEPIIELGRQSVKMVEEDFGIREDGFTKSHNGDFARLTLMLTYLGQLPRKVIRKEVLKYNYLPFLKTMRQRKNKRHGMIDHVLSSLKP